jgi:RNA polymerase subunit RPABC4/transcription elongation factor Spt4
MTSIIREPIIVRNELLPMRARLLCPVCVKPRELEWDGMVLLSVPAQYKHECPACGYTATVEKSYPRVEYKDL